MTHTHITLPWWYMWRVGMGSTPSDSNTWGARLQTCCKIL